MPIEVSSVAQALTLVGEANSLDESQLDVRIRGELAKLLIYVDGKDYHGSFPAEFARGLWEFQECIYGAVALVLCGVEDIRKLTSEQKEDFRLVFEVTEGSLDIQAALEKFFDKLGEGFKNMDSKHKAVTLCAIAAIIATAYGAISVVESGTDEKKAQIEESIRLNQEAEQTERMRILADVATKNSAAAAFNKATEDGARAIVKRAQGASDVRVGRVKFDALDIEEVNQRAAKEKPTAQILEEPFVVVRVETRESTSTKLILANKNHNEFQAILLHDDFAQDDLDKLWAAIRKRGAIALQVNVTNTKSGIKSAQIVGIS